MKTTQQPKKTARVDWHPADIVAALRKSGWSLRQLSLHHGYASGNTLARALRRRWPKAERLIAQAIGIDAAEIWPSRYQGNRTTGTDGRHRESERDVA